MSEASAGVEMEEGDRAGDGAGAPQPRGEVPGGSGQKRTAAVKVSERKT